MRLPTFYELFLSRTGVNEDKKEDDHPPLIKWHG